MKIVKKEIGETNYLSILHITVNLIGYICLYNALIDLSKQITNNRSLDRFMKFANIAMLKDMAIELNELYVFTENLDSTILNELYNTSPEFKDFRGFIKQLRNSMKFFPSERILKCILEKSHNKYPSNILQRFKNDILYYCGYFFGENVVFGSNLYYEYVFYKPLKCCKQEGDLLKFTNSIPNHLKSFYIVFEKQVFKNGIEMPKIKLKERKRFFQIYTQTTQFNKMLKKSKYDKLSIFIFMLIIEEISCMEIYLDYIFDLDESLENPILLYFFTQFVAIKYDEIRDAIDLLIKDAVKFNVDGEMLKRDINNLNVFKNETINFAGRLRNFHHHTEAEKYSISETNGDILSIDLAELYVMVTKSNNWRDFKRMLFEMKKELHTLVTFCRKKVGIDY